MSKFSQMFRYLRKKNGLTQRELAQKLGLAESTISMYELGKREPEFETAEIIADYFNVDMNFLLGSDKTQKGPVYDDEANEIMREMYERPELRALFKTSKKASADDIHAVDKLLRHMAGEEDD